MPLHMAYTTMFKGGWLMTQPSAAVQGWLGDDTAICGCSRVAGPFFSLPQHHRRLFKGCWSVLFTCPQQPSAAVWRRSKVQPLGAALHLRTKCNCLGAADGQPSLDEQMEICGKTYVPNIHIYIYTYIYQDGSAASAS